VPELGLVPAGFTIGSNVGGFEATDEWVNIGITVQPI